MTDSKETPENSSSRVLIVDDEEMVRRVMEESLKRCGYTCVTASNGETALTLMDENPASLIITDINMPGMSGIELVRKVKEKYMTNVIVMTGLIDEYSYESMIEVGADDFRDRPQCLVESLQELFAKPGGETFSRQTSQGCDLKNA